MDIANFNNGGIILAMEEDQPQEIFQSPPEYQSRLQRTSNGGGSAKRYITIIVIIVVIALIILGLFRFLNGGSETTSDITPTPTFETFPTDTPIPTEAVSETPSPSPKISPTGSTTPTTKPTTGDTVDKATGLDRAKLSIHILNGNGETGVSKKASDILEGLGYNVVQIGNADNFDYASTEIQIVSAKSDYIALLKKDLSANYTVGKTTGTPPADEKADAVVIIGK